MTEQVTTILVVEDSKIYQMVIGSILQKEGYAVITADNGQEGIDKYVENPNLNLIVSDVEMPVMSGLDMTKELREIKVNTPIILSGHSDIHLAIDAMHCGANDYLLKDDNMKKSLPLAVKKTLTGHALLEQNHQLMADLTMKNEDLKRLNQELADLNQLKNKFLGIAAHDLRNPLSSIRGFSELLVEDEMDKEEVKEYLNIIYNTSNEMLFMLNDLLDVSVIESGKFDLRKEPANLAELVKHRLHLVQMSAQKKQMQLETDFAEIPDISFDKERIGQVVDNFLTNAIKFSPPASSIRVRVKKVNSMLRVEVQDHGPGLSDEDQGKLFGEFQKLSARPTGGEKSTGLGLAIVKKIVDAHGGQIGVESTLGEGSTFYFALPACQ